MKKVEGKQRKRSKGKEVEEKNRGKEVKGKK